MAAARKQGDGTSPWATLDRLVTRAVGDERRTASILSAALAAARAATRPETADEVAAFARDHLLPALVDLLGARVVRAFAETLAQDLERPIPVAVRRAVARRRDTVPSPASARAAPPVARRRSITGEAGRPMVFVYEPDALQRSSIARALVPAGFDVRSMGTLPELAKLLRSVEPAHFAVVDVSEVGDGSPLRAFGESRRDLPLVLRSPRPNGATALAREHGVTVLRVFAREDSVGELVASLREAAEPPEAAAGRSSFERIAPEALQRVPRLASARGDRGSSPALDPDAAAVLESVDGTADLASIARRRSLPPSDVVRIAALLAARRLITLE
jgi:ActR/RegA family two-component response regulator